MQWVVSVDGQCHRTPGSDQFPSVAGEDNRLKEERVKVSPSPGLLRTLSSLCCHLSWSLPFKTGAEIIGITHPYHRFGIQKARELLEHCQGGKNMLQHSLPVLLWPGTGKGDGGRRFGILSPGVDTGETRFAFPLDGSLTACPAFAIFSTNFLSGSITVPEYG